MLRKNRFIVFAVIAALLSISIVAGAETKENEAFKFRGFEWGTPLEEIKAKEITDDMIEGFDYEYRESENVFVLMTTVAKINLFAFFTFDDDRKLDYGYYVPQTTYIKTDMEYYSEYETINNALIQLYGEPDRYADVIDVNDIPYMSRDDIISKIVQENAIITNIWTAKDNSVIVTNLFFYGGHVRQEIYYLQNYDQLLEMTQENSVSDSEGL